LNDVPIGTTELSLNYWHDGGFAVGNIGEVSLESLDGMEIRVDSPPPEDTDKEERCTGDRVMLPAQSSGISCPSRGLAKFTTRVVFLTTTVSVGKTPAPKPSALEPSARFSSASANQGRRFESHNIWRRHRASGNFLRRRGVNAA
jgi:hypothetical protein